VSNEFLNKAAATIIGVLGRERQLTPAIDVFRRLLLRVDADVNAFVVRPGTAIASLALRVAPLATMKEWRSMALGLLIQ
jgi:hypothetical protein